MRYLQCLLLWVFPWVWGQSEDQLKNFPFRYLQISSFPNSSCSRTDVSAWLGDVQTHRWSNASTISFLKPWSQGKLSDQQWENLQRVFQVYRTSFTRDVQELVKMLPVIHYPIEMQLSAGCEVHSGNSSENFFNVAFQGKHILSFQGTSFHKAPDAPPWIEVAIKVLNSDQGTRETIQQLLNYTCPQVVLGLLEAGKAELEKQEKPVAWLSRGISPRHGHSQLVCHVYGFYPKPVWVMWMQGEQEQKSTQRGDILPNADGTWYLQATLDVEAGKEAGLACWVKHSSLEGKDIILYWAPIKASCSSSLHLPFLRRHLGLQSWSAQEEVKSKQRLFQHVLNENDSAFIMLQVYKPRWFGTNMIADAHTCQNEL